MDMIDGFGNIQKMEDNDYCIGTLSLRFDNDKHDFRSIIFLAFRTITIH